MRLEFGSGIFNIEGYSIRLENLKVGFNPLKPFEVEGTKLVVSDPGTI